ncbi:hypothetical protein RFI_09103, partial [Reticulomyxa filosa]
KKKKRGLQIRDVAIQSSCLKQVADLAEKKVFEYRSLRNMILPKIKAICVMNVPPEAIPKVEVLRVQALSCLGSIFHNFDTDTIKDEVLGSMWELLKRAKSSPILMSVLGVCEKVGKHVSPQLVAEEILTKLIPLATSDALTSNQLSVCYISTYPHITYYMNYVCMHNAYLILFMRVIRHMIDDLEKYRSDIITRKSAIAEASPKTVEEITTVPDDMNSILEKEFDRKVVPNASSSSSSSSSATLDAKKSIGLDTTKSDAIKKDESISNMKKTENDLTATAAQMFGNPNKSSGNLVPMSNPVKSTSEEKTTNDNDSMAFGGFGFDEIPSLSAEKSGSKSLIAKKDVSAQIKTEPSTISMSKSMPITQPQPQPIQPVKKASTVTIGFDDSIVQFLFYTIFFFFLFPFSLSLKFQLALHVNTLNTQIQKMTRLVD